MGAGDSEIAPALSSLRRKKVKWDAPAVRPTVAGGLRR